MASEYMSTICIQQKFNIPLTTLDPEQSSSAIQFSELDEHLSVAQNGRYEKYRVTIIIVSS